VTVEVVRERRALAMEKTKALVAQGLGRPTAQAGFHYCHGCLKDLPDALFDLNKTSSRCIKHMHHDQAVAATQARVQAKKTAALSSTGDDSGRSSSAGILDSVVDGNVVHQEVFRTKAAALEFVESACGHEDHVMYLRSRPKQMHLVAGSLHIPVPLL